MRTEEEQQAIEEEIENDLNDLQDDSDEHPFKANGIDICAVRYIG